MDLTRIIDEKKNSYLLLQTLEDEKNKNKIIIHYEDDETSIISFKPAMIIG